MVNLDCDNIIGARCIESVVAFFGISVVGKVGQRHVARPRVFNHRPHWLQSGLVGRVEGYGETRKA